MEKPETKVLGKEVVKICGVEIEVRLIETPVLNYQTKEWQYRILPRARYLGNSNSTNQQLVRMKVSDALHAVSETEDKNGW